MLTVRTNTLASSSENLRFAINSPNMMELHSEKGVYIKIKGWVLGRDGKPLQLILDNEHQTVINASITRPDVVLVHNDATPVCGFEFYIEAGKDIKVGVILDQQTVWITQIIFDNFGVLKGYDSYLFLDNDSNKSLSQYTGETLIDIENLKKWEDYFLEFEKRQTQLNLQSLFLIAPGKEFIFPDKYPATRKGISTLDQFLCKFPKKYIVNPIEKLALDRNHTYSKTDTHWTHFGARVAAELVCEKFHYPFSEPGNNYYFEKTSGDLGSKLHPKQHEHLVHHDASAITALRIFDNRINNRGRIHVYKNASSSSSKSCMIFGDSFSTTLAPQLVNSFRRLVHVFSGADIDWTLVEHERPDYLISEMTTRFFIKAPSSKFSVSSELSRKYATYSSDKAKRELSKLISYTDPSLDFYKNLCLNALKAHIK